MNREIVEGDDNEYLCTYTRFVLITNNSLSLSIAHFTHFAMTDGLNFPIYFSKRARRLWFFPYTITHLWSSYYLIIVSSVVIRRVSAITKLKSYGVPLNFCVLTSELYSTKRGYLCALMWLTSRAYGITKNKCAINTRK